MEDREIITAARVEHLGEELLSLVAGNLDNPQFRPETYPGLFRLVKIRLDESYAAALESIKIDRRIPIEEFSRRMSLIMDQVEARFMEGVPLHVQVL